MYPNPVLTKIVGEPSNASFKKLKTELYDNAMSVPSNRGGGAHGHLATIMAFAEYNGMIGLGNQWEDPVNPGITPTSSATTPPNSKSPTTTALSLPT
jgi:hypothetical protein